jgi:hypothetical protein
MGRRRRALLSFVTAVVAAAAPLQVLHLALELAPVLQLQLHDAPSGAGFEPRHDTPLPIKANYSILKHRRSVDEAD